MGRSKSGIGKPTHIITIQNNMIQHVIYHADIPTTAIYLSYRKIEHRTAKNAVQSMPTNKHIGKWPSERCLLLIEVFFCQLLSIPFRSQLLYRNPCQTGMKNAQRSRVQLTTTTSEIT